jgi:hypothetical protein
MKDKAQVNDENVGPHASKSQKDIWYKADTIPKWISACAAVLIPVVIGIGSCSIQESISKQSLANVIERPKQEGDDYLREWASKLLVRYSPEPFSPKAQEQLASGGLANLIGGSLGSLFQSPDLSKAAITKTTPSGSFILVFDLHTGRELFQVDAGPGFSPFTPTAWIAWSRDSSRLAALWQAPPYAVAIDVATGKKLGSYKPKTPRGVIGIGFNPDGHSVFITDGENLSESWELPSN